jgi:hypothetical protein
MRLFDLFSRKKQGNQDTIYLGDSIRCSKCNTRLKAKILTPGKIGVSTAEALEGIAIKCSKCDLILCSKCAKPLQTKPCPSCGQTFIPVIPTWPSRKEIEEPPKISPTQDIDKIEDERSQSTKLHLACSHGDIEKVKKCLAQGAKVNIVNKFGSTALDLTYCNGVGHPKIKVFEEIASLLRAKGGKTKTWKGATF